MTKAEIIAALEGLKDYVNDDGKQQIEGIKAGIATLQEAAAVPLDESPKVEPPVDEPPKEEAPAENPPHDLPEEPEQIEKKPTPQKIKKPPAKRGKRGVYKR